MEPREPRESREPREPREPKASKSFFLANLTRILGYIDMALYFLPRIR